MPLHDQISQDMQNAMKEKNAIKVSSLRMLISEINNVAINKRKDKLDNGEILEVINKLVKRHKDSIEQFQNANRIDLVEKEKQQMETLQAYLPQPLSEAELGQIIQEAMASLAQEGKAEMGAVMKLVMEKVRGRADGKTVSQMVAKQIGGAKK